MNQKLKVHQINKKSIFFLMLCFILIYFFINIEYKEIRILYFNEILLLNDKQNYIDESDFKVKNCYFIINHEYVDDFYSIDRRIPFNNIKSSSNNQLYYFKFNALYINLSFLNVNNYFGYDNIQEIEGLVYIFKIFK